MAETKLAKPDEPAKVLPVLNRRQLAQAAERHAILRDLDKTREAILAFIRSAERRGISRTEDITARAGEDFDGSKRELHLRISGPTMLALAKGRLADTDRRIRQCGVEPIPEGQKQ